MRTGEHDAMYSGVMLVENDVVVLFGCADDQEMRTHRLVRFSSSGLLVVGS